MARLFQALVAAAAFAVSPAVTAAPCGAATLADYIALGSCEIDATRFQGFELVAPLPAGAAEIPASAIAGALRRLRRGRPAVSTKTGRQKWRPAGRPFRLPMKR
jgi:hypothetical protein